MNLKKIEIQGFKSFADKTEITFESSITGIVGPNGCGKSNLADAVRWVLGEQTPGILRCKRMNEVIFNGTDSRKSQSYCEVSLYLDNDTQPRRYPVDYDEVVITRKLFRNGESEYSINHTICRLRDIQYLFRDSGIGHDSYSIIGQGKVEQILSAKPEARRQIFEEAAGISRNRVNKTNTERALQNTRDNLARYSDLVQEIGSRLEPLEKEAEEARKVMELRRKLKLTEVSYFVYQARNSGDQRAQIQRKLDAIEGEIAATQEKIDQLGHEYTTDMMDLHNTDVYADQLREQRLTLLVEAERLRGETKHFGDMLRYQREEAVRIREELRNIESRKDECARTRTQKEEEFSLLSTQFLQKQGEHTALEGELEQLSSQVAQQEKTIESGNEMLMENRDKLSEVDARRAQIELERRIIAEGLGEQKEAYRAREKMLKDAQAERDKLAAALETLEGQRSAKADECALARSNFGDAKSEYADTEQALRKQTARKSELEFKIRNLEELMHDFVGYTEVVRNLMRDTASFPELKKAVLGTVGQVIRVPKDYQTAIEIALGGNIQNVITPDEYSASALIDHLRSHSYGRATFLPLTAVRANPLPREFESALDEEGALGLADDLIQFESRFANVMSNLLGRTLVVETREDGIRISKKYRSAFRIVTLDGVLFQAGGAITGGSMGARVSRILPRETELEELKKKLKTVNKELEVMGADLQALGAECQKLEEGVKILEAQVHKLESDAAALRAKIEGADHEVELHRAELDKLMGNDGANARRLKELEQQLQQAEAQQAQMTSEKVSADDFLTDLKDKFYNLRKQRDEMQEAVKQSLVSITAMQAQLDSLSNELTSLKSEQSVNETRRLELISRLNTNAAEQARTQKQLEESTPTGESKEKIDRMQRELDQIQAHKDKLNARLEEINGERELLNRTLSDATARRAREEGTLERLAGDLVNLTNRISEDYGLDEEGAQAFLQDADRTDFVFDPEKAAAEATSLRRRIDRIGPINELAEEKFASEKVRYDDNLAQLQDMQRAEQDLMQVLSDLTGEMTEKFLKAFNQINQNFQEIFRELFGGGHAKLLLDQSEGQSPLEAGIEIEAEPPGTKPTRISLLSGGQRAMTAIAILFAILKMSPMPFSILDEIEAALDDANASLFARYLRKFSDKTQFIVVTHRKPTMEQADVLYGVTQQEKGVSKLVSVRLADALKAIKEE